MRVIVDVHLEGAARPPVGSRVRAEVQDTAWADESSIVVASTSGEVRGAEGSWLETVELEVESLPPNSNVSVHVDLDDTGTVTEGDFITTAAYPVVPGEEIRLAVTVRQV